MSPAHRHRLLCVIAAGLALFSAGCRRDTPHQLNVAVIGGTPLTIGDPIMPPASAIQATLRSNLAQGLVQLDAAGQVEPGLAERWNVSDDGLSYIFRLVPGEWPDGRKFMARDMARILNRQLRAKVDNPTRDGLGAVEEVVAMTDRVIEIRLRVPRSNLLQLLAQPEFALIREGTGSGPFMLRAPSKKDVAPSQGNSSIRMTRRLPGVDGEAGEREDVRLTAMSAETAIAAFRSDRVDLVIGGTIADLPLATRAKLERGVLRFDPASGLFGLIPGHADGPMSEPEVRRLLSRAIDRTALIAALGVPGLGPRATLLQAGLEGLSEPVQPAWLAQPLAERRAALASEAQRLFGTAERPRLTVALPAGPGGDLIFTRLFADWGAIGIGVERAAAGKRADLRLIDAVAPSNSPAWFLRRFRCGQVAVCIPEADVKLQAARDAPFAAQRATLFGEAAALMDEAMLFIPLAAPIRWSLVGDRAVGFQENRFAQHPFAGIMQRATARGYTP